ncbi:MAG: hypothetical protein ACI9M1_002058, partial [Porticoccaceae bacterium]
EEEDCALERDTNPKINIAVINNFFIFSSNLFCLTLVAFQITPRFFDWDWTPMFIYLFDLLI